MIRDDAIETRTTSLITIHKYISDGAHAFLWAEYKILGVFIVVFGLLIFFVLGSAGECGIPKFVNIKDETIVCIESELKEGNFFLNQRMFMGFSTW